MIWIMLKSCFKIISTFFKKNFWKTKVMDLKYIPIFHKKFEFFDMYEKMNAEE